MIPMTTHCRSLRYEYDPDKGVCRFEDGVVYTVREMIFLAHHDLSPEDEDTIHMVKKVIGGEIDTSKPHANVHDWLTELGRSFKPAKRVRVPKLAKRTEPLQTSLDLQSTNATGKSRSTPYRAVLSD